MVKPAYATGIRVQVPTKENEFESKGALKTVELEGLPVGAREPCGKYVCVTDLSGVKLNGDFQCNSFKSDLIKETTCKNMVLAYYLGDQYYRRLDSELGLDIDILRGASRQQQFVHFMPILLNDTAIPHNAAYNPYSRDVSVGSSAERSYPERLDGEILFHELGHGLGDLINPLLAANGYYSASMSLHEGTLADSGVVLLTRDPQVGEGFANAAAGLRTANNTRTFSNIKVYDESLSQIGDPHLVGEIYLGFWWSVHLKFISLLKEKNPTASREHLAKLSSTVLLKAILFTADAYTMPNPMHGDFPYKVIEVIGNMANDGFLKELPEFTIDKDTMIDVVKAEAQRRGFYYIATVEKKEKPGSVQQKNLSLGEGIKFPTLQGGFKLFRQQYYNTAQNGSALVVGHGTIEVQKGTQKTLSTEGIRELNEKKIDETVSIKKQAAFEAALIGFESRLCTSFASRPDDAKVSGGTELKLIAATRAELRVQGFESARLAILPRGKHLVWLFDTKYVRIAVNAKTGKVEEASLRRMVD